MDADTRRILVHALGAVLTVGLLGGLAACAATKPEVTPSAEDAAPAVTVRAYDNAYDIAEVPQTHSPVIVRSCAFPVYWWLRTSLLF